MAIVKVKMGKICQVIGVGIELSGMGGFTPEAMEGLVKRAEANGYSLMKQILVDCIDGEIVAKGHGQPPQTPDIYLSVSMPCGNVVNYRTAKDIPEVDVPCPCGDKSHWIIRYRDLRKEDTNGTKTNR